MINLTQRNKIVLMFGGVFILGFLCFQLLLFPASDRNKALKRLVQVRQDQHKEMILLQNQFNSMNRLGSNKTTINYNKNKDFSLFSFIDQQALQCKVKKNMAFMKPYFSELEKSDFKKAIVKVRLNNLYLKELVDFLYKIESSKNFVLITSLSLTRSGKKDFLIDAIIETEATIPKDSD